MSRTGFAVIYRWRVKPQREADFLAAWETLTIAIRDGRGGLGSRLHRAEDGSWTAYAQWPDRETWERAQSMAPADPAAAGVLRDTVAEAFPPMLLEPVRSLLVAD
jgi:quinol monooxygenase YgiN